MNQEILHVLNDVTVIIILIVSLAILKKNRKFDRIKPMDDDRIYHRLNEMKTERLEKKVKKLTKKINRTK